MKTLRGKRVLVTVPELKKSAIEISAKDEEMIMQEALKKWEKIEGDMVYVQTYALESGEKISIDDHMRILVPENAIAIVW